MTKTNEFSSAIQFPCDFAIKVMGKSGDQFENTVLNIIQKVFPNLPTENIQKRPSKDNNYVALTINVHAESQQQLDQVYQALSDTPEVLFAL